MVKRVDVAMYNLIKELKEGNLKTGIHTYGLKEGGVGLSEMKYTKDSLPENSMEKIKEITSKIINEEIEVTDVFDN